MLRTEETRRSPRQQHGSAEFKEPGKIRSCDSMLEIKHDRTTVRWTTQQLRKQEIPAISLRKQDRPNKGAA